MASDKHGTKGKVTGKLKEVKGKITNYKTRETEGRLQKARGKAKDRAIDLKETLEDKEEG